MEDSTIELRGRLRNEDLVRFQYFHVLRLFFVRVLLVVFPLMLIIVLLALLFPSSSETENAGLFMNFLPMFVVIGFWMGVLLIAPRFAGKKMVKLQPYLAEPVKYIFTAEHVAIESPSLSTSFVWSLIRNVRETKSLFLIYHHPQIAIVVPKHFFDDEQELEQWRGLVRQSMPKHEIEKISWIGRRL